MQQQYFLHAHSRVLWVYCSSKSLALQQQRIRSILPRPNTLTLQNVHYHANPSESCHDITKKSLSLFTSFDLTAFQQSLSAIHTIEDPEKALLYYTDFRPPVKALLGERYSELSIAIAKLLSLYLFPQVL